MALKWPAKDPDAVLDYQLDWSAWLEDDTIVTSTWSVEPAGLVIDSDTNTTTASTIWLSGGTDGVNYAVRNRITTAGGRTDDRTVTLPVVQK